MYDESPPGLGKFINDNQDLELAQDGILIHLLQRDNRLHVMIEVNEDATQDRLRGIIPLACQWRDRVMNHQGAWDWGGDNEYLERLSERQEKGVSYAKLAEMVNKRVEKHLREYLEYRQEVDSLYPEYREKHESDLYNWIFSLELTTNSSAISHAKGLLSPLGIKQSEIDLLLTDGLERLRNGLTPFEKDYPISRYKMIEALRTWRKGKKHKTIQAKRRKEEQEFEAEREGKV